MWPYTYDTCDLGTFIAQQDKNGNPSNETQLGKNGIFSLLPGQKLSSCSCPGSDHPGPTVNTGRGVPEVDMYVPSHLGFLVLRTYHCNCSFESQIDTTTWKGQVSQSFQVAPFDAQYLFNEAGIDISNTSISKMNTYKGGAYQQAVSILTDIPDTSYGGTGWITLGFELWGNSKDRANSYITWHVNGVPAWTAHPASVGANPTTEIGARLISEEPMVSPLAHHAR